MTTILITVDSLRYDYLLSEQREIELPTIDRLVDDGLVFQNAIANAPYTADSFTSILGGTYPWTYGTESKGFEPARPHLGEEFAKAGFDTASIYTNPYLGPTFGYDRGFEYYAEGDDSTTVLGRARQLVVENLSSDSTLFRVIQRYQRRISSTLSLELGGRPYTDAETVNNLFGAYLKDASASTFAWLHYMDVHSPFYPHPDTRSAGIDEPTAIETFYSTNLRPRDVTPSEIRTLKDLYLGEIQYLDQQLGELLDIIDREIGLDDVTILFTSDHGEAFGEHGFCFHPKELYQELVHIPLILYGSGFGQGSIETPVSNVDVMPTLLDDAGLSPPESIEGRPLQEIIDEEPDQRYVFSQAIGDDEKKAMIYDGRFKLIRELTTGSQEVYDIKEDPGEQDLLDGPTDVIDRLESAIEEHLSSMVTDSDMQPTERDVPDSVEEQLKSLGYE